MHISMLYLTNEKAPVTGSAMYVVADEADGRITLLHPPTLQTIAVTINEFRSGREKELWPNDASGRSHINASGIDLNEQVARMIERKANDGTRQYNTMLVRRVLAALRQVRLDQVPALRKQEQAASTAQRGLVIRSEKRPGIIDVINSMMEMEGGASINEMHEELCRRFPDRAQDGMKTTVRCQIRRLPEKMGRELTEHFDADRGRVYTWASRNA